MSVIYKYKIPVIHEGISSKILITGLNSILKVGVQGDDIFLWCEVNPHAIRQCEVEVYIIPTGYEFSNALNIEYLDTVFMYNNSIVFHIYYKLL